MKKMIIVGFLAISVIWMLFIAAFNTIPVKRGKHLATDFFNELIQENNFNDNKISLEDFSELNVSLDDSALMGRVNISLKNKDELKIYKIYFSFSGDHFSPIKVSNLQYIMADYPGRSTNEYVCLMLKKAAARQSFLN
ncbi:MAG: hypothetical protein K0S39_2029 [Paenibacillus sp.]|jgi:hypothetical protein|nr:hypothetical protein [Paenibacillus sp.]